MRHWRPRFPCRNPSKTQRASPDEGKHRSIATLARPQNAHVRCSKGRGVRSPRNQEGQSTSQHCTKRRVKYPRCCVREVEVNTVCVCACQPSRSCAMSALPPTRMVAGRFLKLATVWSSFTACTKPPCEGARSPLFTSWAGIHRVTTTYQPHVPFSPRCLSLPRAFLSRISEGCSRLVVCFPGADQLWSSSRSHR